jgi:hypothetical protein
VGVDRAPEIGAVTWHTTTCCSTQNH